MRSFRVRSHNRGTTLVMRFLNFLFCCFLASFLVAPIYAAQAASAIDAAAGTSVLKSLLAEAWEYELPSSPELATALGDTRFNNRLDDDSPQFHQSELKQNQDFLARFEALSPTGLSPQDALSRELMIRKLH